MRRASRNKLLWEFDKAVMNRRSSFSTPADWRMAMKIGILAAIAVFLFFCSSSSTTASVVTTTSNFLDIADGVVTIFSDPVVGGPQTVAVGPVSVTTTRADVASGIFPFATGDPNNPAGSASFGATIVLPMILNLNEPVAAFGASFHHTFATDPALLKVFDGPDGMGNLVGSITSVPPQPPYSATNIPIDFVAVWSNATEIQSAVIQGVGSTPVDVAAIAVSLTPIPGPPSALLFATGVAGVAFVLRRRRALA